MNENTNISCDLCDNAAQIVVVANGRVYGALCLECYEDCIVDDYFEGDDV